MLAEKAIGGKEGGYGAAACLLLLLPLPLPHLAGCLCIILCPCRGLLNRAPVLTYYDVTLYCTMTHYYDSSRFSASVLTCSLDNVFR